MHRILALWLLFSPIFGHSYQEDAPGQRVLQEEGEPLEDHAPQEKNEVIRQFSRREGYRFAQDLHRNAEWIDFHAVIQGIEDYVSGKPAIASLKGDEHSFAVAIQLFEAEAKKTLIAHVCFYKRSPSIQRLTVLKMARFCMRFFKRVRGRPLFKKAAPPFTVRGTDLRRQRGRYHTQGDGIPSRAPIRDYPWLCQRG